MASPFAEDRESKNTIRATKGCKLIFEEYLNERNLKFPQTCGELAVILQKFYAEVRKKDGLQYTKNSLCSLRFGLNRYFKTLLNIDIIKNVEFDKANRVYEGQCLNLKNIGLAKPERRPPIANDDIMKLYQCGLFNTDSPVTLQNKVFFEIIFYFCRRGRSHLRQLKKDDFAIKMNEQGQRYVVLTDLHTQSKSDDRARGDDSNSGEGGIMIATGGPLCPVESFEKYISHLNPLNDFLFQRPREKCADDNLVWYENSVLGENTLGGKMKALSIQASLSVEYTNHSIKATAIAILNRHGYEAKDIISGSVRCYKTDQSTKAKMAACLMSAIENTQKCPEEPAGCNNVDTKPCLNQTKKRKLEEDFSKESPKNEDLHHNVMCEDTRTTAVSRDENIAPEQRHSPSPEMTKSRRKAPRSQVRKVVRTNSQSKVAETNAASLVVKSETTSNESVTKPECLEKITSNESIEEPESYEKQVDVAQNMNNITTSGVLVSSRNENITIPTVGEHGCGSVNETMVTEEDYQRKYFQLLNTMNDLQDKFLVSQRNFEDFVRAREAFIEELKSTLDDKHLEIDSVKRELEKSNDTILELEEKRKMYEEKIQSLNQKVEDVKRKEAEVKKQVLKDQEEELQQLIEKQQDVLEFYKLLTSVTVEKVVEDQNSSTVYDKFRCSVKTAQTKELEFFLSYDPEFAEVEYAPLALDSQSVDSSFPEYMREQIFFESDQAPNFLCRLIQTFQKPDN